MPMIQIRHVPDELHREIKVRAAREGMSMSDWLLRELRKTLERPSRDELLDRIAKRSSVELPMSTADAMREERDAR